MITKTINKMFSGNSEKFIIDENFKTNLEKLKTQESNIKEKLINVLNSNSKIKNLRINFQRKMNHMKLHQVEKKHIYLVNKRIQFLNKKLADLNHLLETRKIENNPSIKKLKIEEIKDEITLLEMEKKTILNDHKLKLKEIQTAQNLKRNNLNAQHPGKIFYDEPITPFIPMTYSEATRLLNENKLINQNQNEWKNKNKSLNKEIRDCIKNTSDVAEKYGAKSIKQLNQFKGKLKSVLNFSEKILGVCWAYTMENMIQISQGKTLYSTMRVGNKIRISGLNKLFQNQSEYVKKIEKLIKKRNDLLELGSKVGFTDELSKRTKKLYEKIVKINTGEEYLTRHNFIKNHRVSHKLEDMKDEKSREKSVLSLINSITANQNEHQKVYKTIGLQNNLFGHIMCIVLEKQGKTETFTFSDANYNRSHIFNDKQKFESFLRGMFLQKDYLLWNEVIVTDFIYKNEQSQSTWL